MSRRIETDVAVIGAGTGGLSARRAATKEGARALLIEGGPYGTTCARVGCMPSKLLIAAADAAHGARTAGGFGVVVPEVRVDGKAVLERVRRERDRFVGFVVDSTEAIDADQRLRGKARFEAPTRLSVELPDGGKVQVDARSVVIATGSTPFVPDVLRGLGDRLLTSDGIFEIEDLPKSVAVIGTGVVGLELGQALARLGSRVVVIGGDRTLAGLTDAVVRGSFSKALGEEMRLTTGVKLTAASRTAEGVRLQWQLAGGGTHEEEFEKVLAATGRRPRLETLNLAASGVSLDARGRPLFDPRTMQCGETAVFLAGDVGGYRPVLHEAAGEGQIAGVNAARFPEVRAHVRRVPLTIVFTHPQVAVVGKRFSEIDCQATEIGQVDYEDQGRARVMRENVGVVRVYADRESELLVGAEMCGPRVEHTAHLLAWMIARKATVEEALAMPFYHPVVEEGIRTALRDVAARLRVAPPFVRRELECGPGT
jgi:dihydrolipoamide dehydrogenase